MVTGLRKQQPQRRTIQRPAGTQDVSVGAAPRFGKRTVIQGIINVESITSPSYIKDVSTKRGGFAMYKDASNRYILSADGLKIRGNWKIDDNAIYTGTKDFSGYTANAGDMTIYSDGSNASIHAKNFYISSAGNIVAQGGTLGGFTLSSSTLTATNLLLDAGNQEIKLGSGNDIISLDAADATYRLAIGHATYGSAPFRVTKAGAMTSTNATITGTMTANSGTIGGWTLAADAIYTGTKDSAGYTTSGVTLSSASGGSVHAKKWYIDTAGKVFFNTGNFSGAITSTATITGGIVQTSSSGQRIVLDGTNNRINIYNSSGTEIGRITDASGGTLFVIFGIGVPVQLQSGTKYLRVESGEIEFNANLRQTLGSIDAYGGFKDNGVAGVDGTFLDNSGNTVQVRGGIITNLSV